MIPRRGQQISRLLLRRRRFPQDSSDRIRMCCFRQLDEFKPVRGPSWGCELRARGMCYLGIKDLDLLPKKEKKVKISSLMKTKRGEPRNKTASTTLEYHIHSYARLRGSFLLPLSRPRHHPRHGDARATCTSQRRRLPKEPDSCCCSAIRIRHRTSMDLHLFDHRITQSPHAVEYRQAPRGSWKARSAVIASGYISDSAEVGTLRFPGSQDRERTWDCLLLRMGSTGSSCGSD